MGQLISFDKCYLTNSSSFKSNRILVSSVLFCLFNARAIDCLHFHKIYIAAIFEQLFFNCYLRKEEVRVSNLQKKNDIFEYQSRIVKVSAK